MAAVRASVAPCAPARAPLHATQPLVAKMVLFHLKIAHINTFPPRQFGKKRHEESKKTKHTPPLPPLNVVAALPAGLPPLPSVVVCMCVWAAWFPVPSKGFFCCSL